MDIGNINTSYILVGGCKNRLKVPRTEKCISPSVYKWICGGNAVKEMVG